MKYIIIDWAGNRKFLDKEFDSFEDGWGFLYDTFSDEKDESIFDEFFVIEKEKDKK